MPRVKVFGTKFPERVQRELDRKYGATITVPRAERRESADEPEDEPKRKKRAKRTKRAQR